MWISWEEQAVGVDDDDDDDDMFVCSFAFGSLQFRNCVSLCCSISIVQSGYAVNEERFDKGRDRRASIVGRGAKEESSELRSVCRKTEKMTTPVRLFVRPTELTPL